MKRWLLISLLLGSAPAWAQSPEQPPWRVGVLAGAALTGRTDVAVFDILSPESGRFGFYGGLAATYRPNSWLGLQPALLLAQKGYTTGGGSSIFGGYGSGSVTSTDWRLNYLDLPLAVQLHPVPNTGRGWFVEVGPQVSYLLAARYRQTVAANTTQVTAGAATDDYRRLLGGFLLGAGYQGKGPASVGLRYTQDLVPVWPDREVYPGVTYSAGRNWGIQLYIAYQLTLSKAQL